MSEAAGRGLDRPLLERLMAMAITPEGAALDFVTRLARENRWDRAFAQRVYQEYVRFLYLAEKADHPVTPSDEVDQAWHLHLGYSRHYWGVLCKQIVGRPLHHGPTLGGMHEAARYRSDYRATLGSYRHHFGEAPPPDIWPDEKRRFAARYARVETGRHWVVPYTLGAVAVAAPLLASCSMLDGVSRDGRILTFIVLCTLAFGVIYGIIYSLRYPEGKGRNGSGCSGSCGLGGGDSGDSGCSGCGGD